MMDMNPMWRASFFKRSIDAEPASRLIIAAPAEREAAQIAFDHMMDFERVDLVRTLDKSQTIPMDEYPVLHIQGDLATDRDVQVDGHINGNVSCARLTIGKDGAIAGDIKAKEIVVRGKVKGTIRATRVMLMEGADVAGDVFYDRISMEEGARFVGASNAEPLPSTASPPEKTIS